jgi:CubicO group peptidase (beta-lactamase class C family)
MKRLLATAWLFVTIVIVSFMTPTVFGQEKKTATINSSPAESLTARVDKLFAQWDKPDSPGCSLGVSQNGKVVYEHAYGMANLELGVAITPSSVFHIASASKQFTAMAILILAQRGQLSLDDEVRRYITELPDYGTPVTIRHLLTHTSGLRDGFDLADLSEPHDEEVGGNYGLLKRIVRQNALNFAPGTEFRYSNSGYALLAMIVKRVSGQSLRTFAEANIFKPLGMTHTHFHDDPVMIVPNRTSGYYRDERGLHVAIDEWRWASDIVGNAHLYTTTGDLLLWEQNFADLRVGNRALVAAMQTPTSLPSGETSGYGFGLWITQYRGLRRIWHGGGDPGYNANVARYPDQKLAVAVLCNQEDISSARLSQGVVDIYLADAFPTPAASATAAKPVVSLSAEQLMSKVGLYRNPLNDAFRRIWVLDGKLIGRPNAGEGNGSELIPMTANRFLAPGGQVLEFVPAATGRAAEILEFWEGQKSPLVFQRENAFAPSNKELGTFSGRYASAELDTTYTLLVRDSALVIQIRGKSDITLRPIFTDAFQGNRVGVVKFSRDARGVVTGFTVNTDGVRGLRFDRVKQ